MSSFWNRIGMAFLCVSAWGCGSSNSSFNQSGLSGFNAQQEYQSLPAPDLQVYFSIIASQTTERLTQNEFCRKSGAVGPNATYHYDCWRVASTGALSKTTFDTIVVASAYTVEIFIGSTIQESVNGATLCQQTTATSPTATPSYACYQKMQ